MHAQCRERQGNGKPMTWNAEVDDFGQLLSGIADFLLSISSTILLIAGSLFLSRVIRHRIHLFAERRGMHRSVPALADNVVRVVVYIVIGFLVLAALGVNTRSLATFAGLVTAALTLSLQDVLKNIFCGFYLLAERPFTAGDRIRIGAEEGTIERIDLRVTRVRNDRQELVLVPNSVFFSQVTTARSTRRAPSLTMQLAGVQQARESAEAHIRASFGEALSGGTGPSVRLLRIGPAGCDFEITATRVACEDESHVIAALNEAFPDATISIVAR